MLASVNNYAKLIWNTNVGLFAFSMLHRDRHGMLNEHLQRPGRQTVVSNGPNNVADFWVISEKTDWIG